MNNRQWVLGIEILSILALCAVPGLAQGTSFQGQLGRSGWLDSRTDTALYAEYDRLAHMMAQLREPMNDAYYVAAQGGNASSPEDLQVSAQVLINMLEGSDSPLFDEAFEIPLFLNTGIRPVVDSFTFTDGWYDPDETAAKHKQDLEDELEVIQRMLLMVSLYAQEALKVGVEFADQRNNMVTAYSTLSVLTRLRVHSLLLELGYDVWVTPFITIQDAIDSARGGATIYIESGIYEEALKIDKSIVLDGSYVDAIEPYAAVLSGFAAIVAPGGSQIGILIDSASPIQVTIRQMTVQGAAQGILVGGEAQVTLDDVDVIESDIGVSLVDSARVSIVRGSLDENGTALLLDDTSSASVSDSTLQLNSNLEGAIQLHGEATLEMTDTEVSGNAGNGISIQDQAELNLMGSLVSSNGGDGIRLSVKVVKPH